MNQGLWVIAEHRHGELLDVTLEVLSEMKRVAVLMGQEVSAVLMGTGTEDMADILGRYGAVRVYLVGGEMFEPYCQAVYTRQLSELIERYRPRLIAAGATSTTQDYFPRIAALIRAGLVTNCSLMRPAAGGLLRLFKPMYGGKVYAGYAVEESGVIMATVRPGAFSLGIQGESSEARVIEVEPISAPDTFLINRRGFIEPDPKEVDVSEAEVVLAGGNGLGKKEYFERLEDLAEMIGAAVGGSRPAVDNQWIPFERQIGQSGKTVAPRIYIACGISGSSYHVLGMKEARFIIAINNDHRAPILKMADAGVVGDVNEIIPEMIRILGQKSGQEGLDHE